MKIILIHLWHSNLRSFISPLGNSWSYSPLKSSEIDNYSRGLVKHVYTQARSKALWSDVYKQELSTHDKNPDAADNDDTRRTIRDYIGSLAFLPNEPKTRLNDLFPLNIAPSVFGISINVISPGSLCTVCFLCFLP